MSFDLWITSSQVTDLIYILSEAGSRKLLPRVLEQLRGLRTFVNVHAVSDREVDRILAASVEGSGGFADIRVGPGDECRRHRHTQQKDFESSVIKVVDCDEFFAWMHEEFGFDYDEVAI